MNVLKKSESPCQICGKREIFSSDNSCVTCFQNDLQTYLDDWGEDPTEYPCAILPSTRALADAQNINYVINPTATLCRHGKHLKLLSKGGHCLGCAGDKRETRRAVAKAAGDATYSPKFECKACHTHERYVSNGKCTACCPYENAAARTMRESPDLIVSRIEAARMGLKVYRTGESCRQGHAGFRYVKGGRCVSCAKGVDPVKIQPPTYRRRASEYFMKHNGLSTLSHREAVAANLTTYFTGQACKNGHIAHRYVKGYSCVQCRKAPSDSEGRYDGAESLRRLIREYVQIVGEHTGVDFIKELPADLQAQMEAVVNP